MLWWRREALRQTRQYPEKPGWTIISCDYREASDAIKEACKYGDPSISVATVESFKIPSLPGYRRCGKNITNGRREVVTTKGDKFEASSRNKPRSKESIEVGYVSKGDTELDRDDIFAETKDREGLVKAIYMQSGHWKKIMIRALAQ